MTSVLGWDAPTVDPFAADRLIDLGVDFLIDRRIASLLEAPGSGRDHKGLRRRFSRTKSVADYIDITGQALARTRDLLPSRATAVPALPDAMQPWFDATALMVTESLGDKHYNRALSLGLQVMDASEPLTALAYARQGLRQLLDPAAPLLLAAPLVPTAGRVADGPGPVAVFEIGEPTHPFASQGHADARAALGPLKDQVRWHWIYGPSHEHAQSLAACCLVEAALEQDPTGLWTHAPDLMKQAMYLRLGHFEEVLRVIRWPADPRRAVARAQSDDIKARVERDLALLDAVGVPEIRPAFVVGRRVFAGRDAYSALAAAITPPG